MDLYNAGTPEGNVALIEGLEKFRVATLSGTGNVKFQVSPRVAQLYPDMYHYGSSRSFDSRFFEIRDGKLYSLGNPPDGRYVTPDVYGIRTEAMYKMQLPPNGPTTARYRFKFKTEQVKEAFEVPYANDIKVVSTGNYQYDKTSYLEPKTRQNTHVGGPDGGGGSPQFIQFGTIELDEVFDLELGRTLTLDEITQLINAASN